jgi:DNA-binding MarR family transcriptional regulator
MLRLRMTGREESLQHIGKDLGLLFRRLRSFAASTAKAIHADLEPESYGLLVRVDELGSATGSELAEYFGVGRPTISRQLAALERLEMIKRAPHSVDGRSSVITLSGAGEMRLRTIRAAQQKRFQEFFTGWSEDEIAQLETSLARLNSSTF